MPQSEVIGARGLYINPSLYVNLPPGAMEEANNVYIDRDYLITSRRGFTSQAITTSGTPAIYAFFYFNGYLCAYGNSSNFYRLDGSTWTEINWPIPASISWARVIGQGNKNYYFPSFNTIQTNTNRNVVWKMENYNSTNTTTKPGVPTFLRAGLPQIMNTNVFTLSNVGTPLWFTNGSSVAYRAIYGYKDYNNNVVISGVSGRCVVTNSAGFSTAPNVQVQIPAAFTNGVISGSTYTPTYSLVAGYHFVQIYRSEMTTSPIIPSDNLKLVYELPITSTDITNQYVSVTDYVAPGLEGVPLYTNSDQEGIVANNAKLPLATIVSSYKSMLMYSCFKTLSMASIQMIAIGGTSGIAVNDRLRFIVRNGLNSPRKVDLFITAALATNVGLQQWDINTASTAAGIEYSMNQFCQVMNVSALAGVITAKYISEINSLPGQVMFFCEDPFYIVANTATAASAFGFTRPPFVKIVLGAGTVNTTNGNFTSAAHGFQTGDTVVVFWDEPTDPTGTQPSGLDTITNVVYYATRVDANNFKLSSTVGGSVIVPTTTGSGTLTFAVPMISSNNDTFPHCVAPSKIDRSEEVAEVYAFGGLPVGEANFAIINQIQLRDTFFIFKEDGLWTINGDSPNDLRVQQFDPTCKLTARASIAILNNSIFCLSRLGIVRISENGVQIVSNQIRDAIAEINTSLTAAMSNGFNYDQGVQAFSYESENKYSIYIPTAVNATYGGKWFVYNTLTDSWTTMDKGYYAGIVNPNDNKCYLASLAGANIVYQERKTGDYSDYIDEDLAVTISAVSGTTVSLVSSSGVSVGDVLWQSSIIWTFITAINGNDLTVFGEPGFTTGARTVKKKFTQSVSYFPIHLGAPGISKNFRDCTVNLQGSLFYQIDYRFKTDFSGSEQGSIIESDSWMQGGFGMMPFGSGPFGGSVSSYNQSPRLMIPRDKARATYIVPKLTVDWGYSKINLSGLSINYEIVSERTRK